MTLTFLPASETDIELIFNLSRNLILKYEDTASIDLLRILAWVRRKIDEHIHEYRRILREGVHVGYYRLFTGELGRELDDLYIFPEYQNQGIGTEIISRCCAQGPLSLYVFTKNTGALSLYRRLGFREIQTVGSTRLILRKE